MARSMSHLLRTCQADVDDDDVDDDGDDDDGVGRSRAYVPSASTRHTADDSGLPRCCARFDRKRRKRAGQTLSSLTHAHTCSHTHSDFHTLTHTHAHRETRFAQLMRSRNSPQAEETTSAIVAPSCTRHHRTALSHAHPPKVCGSPGNFSANLNARSNGDFMLTRIHLSECTKPTVNSCRHA
eukprot:286276-Pleurochrysis_carterae.AAC.2